MLHLTFYTDPGHGWLQVQRDDLVAIGLSEQDFTSCSYKTKHGETLYLEEDCDAPKFIEALKAKGIQYGVVEVYHHKTFIRDLPHTVGGWSPFARRA